MPNESSATPREYAADLLTFLTVICHQPYYEARKIPLSVAISMGLRVGHWVETFFGKISDKVPSAENIVKGILPPEQWDKNISRKTQPPELKP